MARFFSHMGNVSVHQGHAEQQEAFLLAVRLAVNFPESRDSFFESPRGTLKVPLQVPKSISSMLHKA